MNYVGLIVGITFYLEVGITTLLRSRYATMTKRKRLKVCLLWWVYLVIEYIEYKFVKLIEED